MILKVMTFSKRNKKNVTLNKMAKLNQQNDPQHNNIKGDTQHNVIQNNQAQRLC
jgi:hypothetical protein